MKAVEESGTEPGLFEEAQKFAEYHQGRAAEFEEAVSIGKKLGITVEFDENLAANGVHTADGRIIINPNTENPALQVFVHELTHDIETSGLYKQFSKRIFGFIENAGIDIETMRTKVREDYSEAGIELSSAQTDAEIVAKFAEQYLFTNEKAIERLCNTEPTLFERIRYWISDMAAKFKGEPEERFLRETERLYEKALATRGERTGAGVEQFSFMGYNQDGIEVYETSQATKNLTWKDRKAKYLDMIKNIYRGRTAKFERNGHVFYAEFDLSSVRKHIYGDNRTSTKGVKALINAGADGDVFDIAENAKYGGSGKNTKNHTNADYFDHFLKTVQIDNKVFDVIADVEKNYGVDGGYIYTIALIDSTKKASPALGQPNSAPVKSAGNAFNSTLPQTKPVVNSQGGNTHSLGRGFDELAAESKTEHGIAEELSAEVTESAKRVLGQMVRKPKVKSTMGQVNGESESTKTVDVPQSEKSKRRIRSNITNKKCPAEKWRGLKFCYSMKAAFLFR
ncbi:MAG: hypothetical protein IJ945_07740 [Oscillospiraceae bacterium]|nr:hypothetical protein [Oscillospiraceae bacterium]